MPKSTTRARNAVLAFALIAVAACGTLSRTYGYVPADDDLEAVVVGLDTRTTVRTILGPPGANGILDNRGWYYVQSQFDSFGTRAPVEVDRQVVAVSFDERGVVSNVERFGIEDGRVIALSRRVTDANTQGIGFLRQLFGNLGRIDPAALLGGGPGGQG